MTTEQRDPLRQSGIDYNEAMERFGGNAALFERLALKFLNDPHFDELEQALAAGQIEEAYRAAHSLKGVAGNLSFSTLYRSSCRVSDALHQSDLDAAIAAMPETREAYQAIMNALKSLKG